MKILKACAIGCAAVLALGVVSCVGFVMWLNQPGEMADTELLVGAETTGFAVWELSLDDPGTAALVEQLLESLARSRGRMQSPLPAVLDGWLKDLQQSRDAKKLRELFPLAVAWSMRPDPGGEGDLHLLAVSVERLGNRGVFVDWILGWLLARSHEVDVIRHQGEQIFVVESGAAFFLRGSNVLVASDVDSARWAVERLWHEAATPPVAGEIDQLLATVRRRGPLHGAVLNRDGGLHRVVRSLSDGELLGLPTDWPWDETTAVTLGGGFTDASAFRATVTVHTAGEPWARERADQLGGFVRGVVEGVAGTEVRALLEGRLLEVELLIDDLPRRVEQWLDAATAEAQRYRTVEDPNTV